MTPNEKKILNIFENYYAGIPGEAVSICAKIAVEEKIPLENVLDIIDTDISISSVGSKLRKLARR